MIKSDRINSENSWETLQFPKKLEKSRAASLGKKIEIIRQPSFRWVSLKSNERVARTLKSAFSLLIFITVPRCFDQGQVDDVADKFICEYVNIPVST